MASDFNKRVDLNTLLDEGIREVKQATEYIIKEASHYYDNTNNDTPQYRINFSEIYELAKRV